MLKKRKVINFILKHKLHIWLASAFLLFLAVSPVVEDYNPNRVNNLNFAQILNFIAWISLLIVFLERNNLKSRLRRTINSVNFGQKEGSLEEQLQSYIYESQRFHRASYAYLNKEKVEENYLGLNLKKIVEQVFEELDPIAAELSLYDYEFDLWTQSLLIGTPKSIYTQSMLVQASLHENKNKMTRSIKKENVLVETMEFAGTKFGALRIEFPQHRVLSENDTQVAKLLATQGALMLIDAKFSEELITLRRNNEETVRAKTGFLANLSHEIRGPLGTILNGAELQINGLCGEVSDAQKETLSMIKNSGEHLLDLVNDVLDYAKVESGKIIPKGVNLMLKPILQDLINVTRSQAIAKKHKLKLLDVPEDVAIFCDKRHFRQIVINFLTNAIKYTPEGGEISLGASKESHNRVRIWIKDNGIGISLDDRSKVFGAFERIENSYTSSQLGTGLGMPLTKRLAEANDGGVDFESTEGEGSKFWLTLPLGDSLKPDLEVNELSGAIKQYGKGENVLLVDLSINPNDMVQRYLDEQGFAVTSVNSAAKAIGALRECNFNLAIVENDVSDQKSEEMVSSLRSVPAISSCPIILLSADAFTFDIERYLKLGVDRYLPKPIKLNELSETLRILIDESTTK